MAKLTPICAILLLFASSAMATSSVGTGILVDSLTEYSPFGIGSPRVAINNLDGLAYSFASRTASTDCFLARIRNFRSSSIARIIIADAGEPSPPYSECAYGTCDGICLDEILPFDPQPCGVFGEFDKFPLGGMANATEYLGYGADVSYRDPQYSCDQAQNLGGFTYAFFDDFASSGHSSGQLIPNLSCGYAYQSPIIAPQWTHDATFLRVSRDGQSIIFSQACHEHVNPIAPPTLVFRDINGDCVPSPEDLSAVSGGSYGSGLLYWNESGFPRNATLGHETVLFTYAVGHGAVILGADAADDYYVILQDGAPLGVPSGDALYVAPPGTPVSVSSLVPETETDVGIFGGQTAFVFSIGIDTGISANALMIYRPNLPSNNLRTLYKSGGTAYNDERLANPHSPQIGVDCAGVSIITFIADNLDDGYRKGIYYRCPASPTPIPIVKNGDPAPGYPSGWTIVFNTGPGNNVALDYEVNDVGEIAVFTNVQNGDHTITEGAVFVYEIGGRCQCAADLNDDFVVNAADLTVLSGQWGQSVPVGTGADVNCDGSVNSDDFFVLVNAYGIKCDSID